MYWPDGSKQTFGEFSVNLLDKEECTGYIIRKLSVQMKKVL